jgi:type I restriction enzyme R subunit
MPPVIASSGLPSHAAGAVLQSQLPALQLLLGLGYEYVSPQQARDLRGGRLGNVLLEEVLREALKRINRIQAGGDFHRFTEENISGAIQKLKALRHEGLITGNRAAHELLALGTSMEQTIDGDTRGRTLRYVDWDHPQNNLWHLAPEFEVERHRSTKTVRLDLVCFVNGIPLAVIECRAPDEPIEEAVNSLIAQQAAGQIPHLYTSTQVLLAVNRRSVRVGTVGASPRFFGEWPQASDDIAIRRAIDTPVPHEVSVDLFHALVGRAAPFAQQEEAAYQVLRGISAQDRAIHALLRPERLLALTRHYTVFDEGERKLARHQQVRAIEKLMERIQQWEPSPLGPTQTNPLAQRRRGGVVWHTQGSGKSLTMVMLARRIARMPGVLNPRIVLVTDREDLDKQIKGTFEQCGLSPERARSARELLDLVHSPRAQVVTTLIQKFERVTALSRQVTVDSPDIFVLVDEGHRTNFGTLAARMRLLMPNACYIGFTGTPVTRKERNTLERFGGLIDSYTIGEAVKDGAVVPLLHESRDVDIADDTPALQGWWSRITAGLDDEQAARLRDRHDRALEAHPEDRRLIMLAFDISEHFRSSWQGTPFKGQVVAQSRAAAVKLKGYIDDIGHVSCDVLVSGPQHRQPRDEGDDAADDAVHAFWKKAMARHGNEENYNRALIDAFKHGEQPELLIVKDKLLTGFDAPRNRVLYVTRELKDHTLLQAIARVNRVYEASSPEGGHIGKDFGQIIDYAGVLPELQGAMSSYQALSGFDERDLEGTLASAHAEVRRLGEIHAHLLELFRDVPDGAGMAAHEAVLRDATLREDFYDRLAALARLLALALSQERFWLETSAGQIDRFKSDLRRLLCLKRSLQRRFAEPADLQRDFDPRVGKMLQTHLRAGELCVPVHPLDVFDAGAVDRAVATLDGSPALARADILAHHLVQVIAERIKVDPAWYEPLARSIALAIGEYRARRINEAAYLARAEQVFAAVSNRPQDDVPLALRGRDDAVAIHGLVRRMFEDIAPDHAALLAEETTLAITAALARHDVVDYWHNHDALNATRVAIDHFLYDVVEDRHGVPLTAAQMDLIIEQGLQLARHHGINGR